MAKIDINRVCNANVYLDGTSFLGRAESVDLPNIKHKFAEHKALGMARQYRDLHQRRAHRRGAAGGVPDRPVRQHPGRQLQAAR